MVFGSCLLSLSMFSRPVLVVSYMHDHLFSCVMIFNCQGLHPVLFIHLSAYGHTRAARWPVLLYKHLCTFLQRHHVLISLGYRNNAVFSHLWHSHTAFQSNSTFYHLINNIWGLNFFISLFNSCYCLSFDSGPPSVWRVTSHLGVALLVNPLSPEFSPPPVLLICSLGVKGQDSVTDLLR